MENVFEQKLTKGMMEALVKWQGVKPEIKFDATNPHFKSKYASLAGIIKAVKDDLSGCGLSYTHLVTNGQIVTLLMHPESEGVMVSSRPLPDGGKVQDEGSLITYQKRYQLAAMLGIAGEEDTDAQNISTGGKPRASEQEIQTCIVHEKQGMKAGNKQAFERLYSARQLDSAQIRLLMFEELFMFEDMTAKLIDRMEALGYEIKKVK